MATDSPEPALPSAIYRMARSADNLSLRFLDLGMVAAAWALATMAGFAASPDENASIHLAWILPVAVVLQVIGHRFAGLYGPVWRYASVDEAFRVVAGVLGGSLMATLWIAGTASAADAAFPFLTAPPLSAFLALLGCGGV
ncbi:MAG: hypothetical protein GX643_08225, partial [Acidimicrobiales bacterium]|nr:hypothetical protein [Acidimicrobiales bacterium]